MHLNWNLLRSRNKSYIQFNLKMNYSVCWQKLNKFLCFHKQSKENRRFRFTGTLCQFYAAVPPANSIHLYGHQK